MFQGSYEVPLATLVVLALWLVQRHLEAPRPATLIGLSTVLTALVMTRSAFHPLWLLAVVALVAVARPVPTRAVVAAVAIPLVLVGGWMGKNQLLFDAPTLSSWVGFNAQRGVVAPLDRNVVAAEVANGTVTPLATQAPWLSIDSYADREPCRPDERHPAVSQANKATAPFKVANFNYSCYLRLYEESQDNATTLARRHPAEYLRDRGAALTFAFTVNPLGTDDPPPSFTGSREPARTWMDALGSVVLVPVSTTVSMETWNLPLLGRDELPIDVSLTLIAGFLAVVGRGGLGAVRLTRAGWRDRAETWRSAEVTWVVLASVAGLLVVGAAMVELGENDRFRATVDPVLIALPLALVGQRITTALGWHRTEDSARPVEQPPPGGGRGVGATPRVRQPLGSSPGSRAGRDDRDEPGRRRPALRRGKPGRAGLARAGDEVARGTRRQG